MTQITVWVSVLFLAFFATTAFGANETFSPLTGLPGITNLKTATLPEYINAIYLALIGFGALIAVIRIAWAGVKYATHPGNHHEIEGAKDDIRGVLLGLAILLLPYVVLNTINPELTSLNVLKSAPNVNTKDNSIKLSTEQQTQISDCLARSGTEVKYFYDTALNMCVELATGPSDAENGRALCEATGNIWNASQYPADPFPCVPISTVSPTTGTSATSNQTSSVGSDANPTSVSGCDDGRNPEQCVDLTY